jgi:hypothetical protein
MLRVTPTVIQVVTSGVDWPAIVAGISAGVAAVAGIGATFWQAKRGWGHEDKNVRIAEKRRVYVRCLTAYSAVWQAVLYNISFKGTEQGKEAFQELRHAVKESSNVFSELQLIASSDVSFAGNAMQARVSQLIINMAGSSPEEVFEPFIKTLVELIGAMRSDLGEPSLARDVAAMISQTPTQGGGGESVQ